MYNLATMTASRAMTETGYFSEDLITRWISFVDRTPKTVQTYTRAIKQFMLYLQAQGITQPKREDIIAYRDNLKANHKATTVQSYMAAVKLFFSWTALEGLYPNVAQRITGVKIDEDHKKDYLTQSEAAQLLGSIDRSTIQGKRDYAILALMVTTGLRTVQVTRANIEDMRKAGESMALYHQGKGHDEHQAKYCKLAAPVEAAIKDYLAARGEEQNPKAPLFASLANKNSGERMTTRSISRIAKDHLIAIGLDSDRLTAHSLRHTAATINLRNGATLEETQQLLGHRDINTTLIYVHALDREKNESEARIARAIFG